MCLLKTITWQPEMSTHYFWRFIQRYCAVFEGPNQAIIVGIGLTPVLEVNDASRVAKIPSNITRIMNHDRMVVGIVWRRPTHTNGFILEGKYYRQGEATAQTPSVTAVYGMGITTLLLHTCNLITIACGRWSQLKWCSEVLFLSIKVLGATPKQQQHHVCTLHFQQSPYVSMLRRVRLLWEALAWMPSFLTYRALRRHEEGLTSAYR